MNLQDIQTKADLVTYMREVNINDFVDLRNVESFNANELAGVLGFIISNYDLFDLTEETIRAYDAMTKRVFTTEEFTFEEGWGGLSFSDDFESMLRSIVGFHLYEACDDTCVDEFKALIETCQKVYPDTFDNMFEEWEAYYND